MKEFLSIEKEPGFKARFLEESEKEKYREAVFGLLNEYPDHFFQGFFEAPAAEDFEKNQVVIATEGERAIGCIFFNTQTNECDWLAISKNLKGSKAPVARKLFETVFASVPQGTKVFWHVNTEDALFEGKPVGKAFEPARRLYREMGATFTKVENKYGEGNHGYLVEVIT